jgi:hypothetical protein
MVCTDNTGTPIDITGAVEAHIRVNRDEGSQPIVEFDVNLTDAVQGIVILSLTGEKTQDLIDAFTEENKFTGVWDVEWTPANMEPRTLCQGKVECGADVTR